MKHANSARGAEHILCAIAASFLPLPSPLSTQSVPLSVPLESVLTVSWLMLSQLNRWISTLLWFCCHVFVSNVPQCVARAFAYVLRQQFVRLAQR